MGVFDFLRSKKATRAEVIGHLPDKLEAIGRIKNALPFNQRGWCNELGLFVQLREAAGMARLEAGGQRRANIDLWRDLGSQSWKVRRYDPGEWEALVDPTLKLAQWLAERGGAAEPVANAFRQAIMLFKSTGRLELPSGMRSFTADSGVGGSAPGRVTKGSESDLRQTLFSHWQFLRHGDEHGRKANFSYASLAGVDLSRARLDEVYYGGVDIGKVEAGGIIPGVHQGRLIDTDFTGANLTKANFSGTNLYGAILTGADLSGANLTGADLRIGSLAYAELTGANLSGANLEYTSLEAANLADAMGLTQEQIKSANINELTRLPSYLRLSAEGGQETAGRNVSLPPFAEAIHLNPQNGSEYFYRGVAYHHTGQYQKAIKDFSEVVRLDPQNAQGYHYLGQTYYHNGQYEYAANSFSEVIRLTPRNALAYNSRANCYLKLLQFQRAIEDYSAAIRCDPQRAIFYINRGGTYRALGMAAEANQDSARAAELTARL